MTEDQKRIQEIKQISPTGAGCKLDLQELNLTEIPNEVWELVGLEELYLSNNQIKVIPQDVQQLKKCKYIHIDKNPIEKLISFSGMTLDYVQYKKFESIFEL